MSSNREDNIIIKLKFDNGDFEKNVEQSMSTLDRLKEQLKFGGVSEGIEAVTASIDKFSLSKLGESIGTVTTKFDTLGVIGKRVLENLTDSAMRFGSNLINSVVEPIKSGGWRRALNLEQANFMLEGLLGNTENGAQKIEDIMKAVKESVTGTAYGMDEAAKVASQLVASGVEDYSTMLTMLKGIAGTAAMTGGSFSELGDIFTTVAGNGKLMTEQLRQFSHRGLNVAAELAKQLNVTEGEIREMISDGEIDFMTFSNAMSEAFGEHATKANDTYTGSLANLRAALARIGADVATPALTNLRDIFNALRPLIDGVHEALMPLINVFNSDFTYATGKAVSFIGELTDKVKEFVSGFKKDAETTEEVAQSAALSAEEIEKYAREVISGKYGNDEETRRQALEALGLSFEKIQNKVNELLDCDFRYEVAEEEVTEAVSEHAEATNKLAKEQEKANKFFREKAIDKFFDSIKNIVKAVSQFGKVAGVAFKEVFNGSFSRKLYEISLRFKRFTENLIMSDEESSGLKVVLKALFTVIRNGLNVLGYLGNKFLGLLSVLSGARRKFLEFVDWFSKWNGEMDKTDKKTAVLKSMRTVLTKLGDTLSEFKNKFKKTIEAVKETDGFKRLYDVLGKLWERIKEISGKVFDNILKKLDAFGEYNPDMSWVDKVAEWIGKAADKLATFVERLLNGEGPISDFFAWFSPIVVTNFERFVTYLTTAKDNIVEFFQSFGLSDAFNQFIQYFSGITWEDVYNGIIAFINGAQTSVAGDGSLESTNETISTFSQFVQQIITYFQNLDLEEAKALLDKAAAVAGKLLLFIGELKLIFSAANALQGIANAFNNVSQVLTSATSMFNSVSNFFTGLREQINEYIKAQKYGMVLKAAALLIVAVAGSLLVLSYIPEDKLTHAVESLFVIVVTIGAILAFIGTSPFVDTKKIEEFGLAVAGIGAGILLMLPAILILGDPSMFSRALTGTGFVVSIMFAMAVAAGVAGAIGAGKGALAFLGLALAVDLIVPAIIILGSIPVAKVDQGVTAVGYVVTELAIAAAIAGAFGGGKGALVFLGVALAIDLLVPALLILGVTPWNVIKQGVIALGIVLFELAAAALIAKNGDWKTIAAMTLPLAAAIIGLYVLKDTPWDQLILSAAALGIVLLSVAGAAAIASSATLEGLGMMVMMAGLILVVTSSLDQLADHPWENIIGAAGSLAIVFLGVSAALFILSHIDLGAGVQGILLLMGVLVSLGLVCGIMASLFGEGGQYPDLMKTAIPVMEDFGKAIGGFFGGLLEQFNEGVSSSIERLGEALGNFGDSIAPFVDQLKKVDAGVLAGAGYLSGACLAIIGTEFINNLTTFFGLGESPLVKFGKELVQFGVYMKNYAGKVKDITEETVKGSANAAECLATMYSKVTAAGVSGGMIDRFLNGDPLIKFGEELASFGPNILRYSSYAKKIDKESVEGSAGAGTMLAEMYKKVVDAGVDSGFIAQITNNNPLVKFGTELEAFGPHIAAYAQSIAGITGEDMEKAAAAGTLSAEMYKTIKESGIESGFFADKPLQAFGEELKAFGTPFKEYADSISGINAADITDAAAAAENSANMYTVVNNAGVLYSNPLETFATQLKTFGSLFYDYSEWAYEIYLNSDYIFDTTSALINTAMMANSINNGDGELLMDFAGGLVVFGEGYNSFGENVSKISKTFVDKAVDATYGVIDVCKSMPGVSTIIMRSFGGAVDAFGTDLKSYYDSIKDIAHSKIAAAIQSTYDLIEVGKAMAYVNTITMANFGKALENVGRTGVDAFIASFTNAYPRAKSAAIWLVQAAADGAASGNPYWTFWNIGVQCINGLINGLSAREQVQAVYDTAMYVADTVVSGVVDALGIFSPSRKLYELGHYGVRGFVNAFVDGTETVFESSGKLGETALRALTKPVEAIQRMLDTDLDLSPTIAPVMDLTNLSLGADQANDMLNGINGQILASSLNASSIQIGTGGDYQSRQFDRLIDKLEALVNDDEPRTINNTFNISGDHPREIADEVSRIIARQVERKQASWA